MCLIANKKSQKLSLVKHGENLPGVSVRFSADVEFLLLIFCCAVDFLQVFIIVVVVVVAKSTGEQRNL